MGGANGAERKNLRVIGKPHRKVDAASKVTGQTKYADDLVFPRMLYTKILRSTVPHGRILKIDTSKAESYPGVKVVLLGKEMPIPYGALPVSEDEHALAIGKVRMMGDPVAAVAAVDEDESAAGPDAKVPGLAIEWLGGLRVDATTKENTDQK